MSIIRTTLWITAVYNLVAATMLNFPSSGLGRFAELPTDVPTLYLVLSSYFVLAFGFLYAWMARQDQVIRPLLYFCAFAKSGAFLIALILWMLGEVSGRLAFLVVGDAIFATIWFAWLYRNPGTDKAG